MKDSQNRGIIRLGDTTDHGGKVITARPDFKVYGKRVAVEGDKVRCPQCKGVFLIVPVKEDREHHGKIVAFEGDRTTCGARLISSI